jgi:hypothetical protein
MTQLRRGGAFVSEPLSSLAVPVWDFAALLAIVRCRFEKW